MQSYSKQRKINQFNIQTTAQSLHSFTWSKARKEETRAELFPVEPMRHHKDQEENETYS